MPSSWQFSVNDVWSTADWHSNGECILSLFLIPEYDYDGFSGRAGEASLPGNIDGAYAFDLSVYFCADGNSIGYYGISEIQIGE